MTGGKGFGLASVRAFFAAFEAPRKRAFAGPLESEGFEKSVIATGFDWSCLLLADLRKKDGTVDDTGAKAVDGSSINLPTGSWGKGVETGYIVEGSGDACGSGLASILFAYWDEH